DRDDPGDSYLWEAFDSPSPYIRVENSINPGDRSVCEAFDWLYHKGDGIYEAIGPKIQGGRYGLDGHMLIRVYPCNHALAIREEIITRTFDGLRAYLQSHADVEGIV